METPESQIGDFVSALSQSHPHVIEGVLSHLSPIDLDDVKLVSREWNNFISDNEHLVPPGSREPPSGRIWVQKNRRPVVRTEKRACVEMRNVRLLGTYRYTGLGSTPNFFYQKSPRKGLRNRTENILESYTHGSKMVFKEEADLHAHVVDESGTSVFHKKTRNKYDIPIPVSEGSLSAFSISKLCINIPPSRPTNFLHCQLRPQYKQDGTLRKYVLLIRGYM